MRPDKDKPKHDDQEQTKRLRAFVKAQPKETEKKLRELLRERGLLSEHDDDR